MYMVYKLVLNVISGYEWEAGNTFDDENDARSEALYWLRNSPAAGDPGYTPNAGYWGWSIQLGQWIWQTVSL